MSGDGESIEVLARGVCIVRGQVLLCQSRGAANTYLPGGHVEFREQAARALEREIREELGMRAKAGRFLGCCEHAFRQKGRWHAEVNLVFALAIPGLRPGADPAAREDGIAFRWWPLRALAASALEPSPMRALLAAWRRMPGFATSPGLAGGSGLTASRRARRRRRPTSPPRP
jgi:ADP-ribose pyrophosphatase YjhB (NUDIX family)